MKNIHLFESKDAFDKAKSGLILPTVSYIKENKDVKYNPTFDANGHKFVEIAGIKWATMNVGATSITDYGYYFQWGDIQGYTKDEIKKEHKKQFARDWSDYSLATNGGQPFTKYNGTDGYTELELVDDAVHAYMKGSWRMPTKGEIDTLLNSTAVTKTLTTGYNGTSVNGYEFHDNNSKDTLFLPACGYALDGSVGSVGSNANYWLRSLRADRVSEACALRFYSSGAYVDNRGRYYGHCVRGVLAEN